MNIKNLPDQETLRRCLRDSKSDTADYLYHYVSTFYPQLCKDLLLYWDAMPQSKKDREVSTCGPNNAKIITTVEELAVYDNRIEQPAAFRDTDSPREEDPTAYQRGVELYVAFCDLRKINAYVTYTEVIEQIRDNKELHEYWFI